MIYVIGLGIEGKESLSKKALKLIDCASVLIGGRRHLACFPGFKGEKIVIGANLDNVAEAIKNSLHLTSHTSRHVVVLATGDPNFFGIADFLSKNLGKNKFEIIPNVSTMQEAFARIKENWNDAGFFSLHGREQGQGYGVGQPFPDRSTQGQGWRKNTATWLPWSKDNGNTTALLQNIIGEISAYNKVGIFTDHENTPSKIAKALLNRGVKEYIAYVCEDLGTDKERVTKGNLTQITKKSFSPLNVMVLLRNQESGKRSQEKKSFHASRITHHCIFGIPDSEFAHSKGMLTKEEIRIISLSKLRLKHNSIVWDIGAGSGSVSTEAALFARNGRVFAVEKNQKQITHIKRNKERFNAENLDIIHGTAPHILKGLPAPDAVFIGGGGKALAEILALCSRKIKPKGKLVVNAVTIETLSAAVEFFKKTGWVPEIISVNIAKTRDVANFHLFNGFNPVFIIVGEKK